MSCSPVIESRRAGTPARAAGHAGQDAPRFRCDRIRLATRADIPALAEIHTEGMPRDFLVRLGRAFQTRVLFPTMLEAPGSRVYVAEGGGEVLGFLVARRGFAGLVSEMGARHPGWFLTACLGATLRRPSLLRHAVSALAQLRTRGAQPDEPDAAELFLMAVDRRARRRGVGRALVEHSAAQLRADGITGYRVLLHADNEPANRLYETSGFAERKVYRFAGDLWHERERKLAQTADAGGGDRVERPKGSAVAAAEFARCSE